MRQVARAPRILTMTGERGSPRESLAGGCLLTARPRVEPSASLHPPGSAPARGGFHRKPGWEARKAGEQIAFSREYEIRGGGVSR